MAVLSSRNRCNSASSMSDVSCVYVVLDSKGMFVFSLNMPENKRRFGAEDAARALQQLRLSEFRLTSKSLRSVV
jgi:hypothetical protein